MTSEKSGFNPLTARSNVRLFQPGVILGYKRSQRGQHPNQCLVRIADVMTKEDTQYYLGKRVLYLYKSDGSSSAKKKEAKEVRVLTGKIIRSHGNGGTVRVKFKKNISPNAFGRKCRILMY